MTEAFFSAQVRWLLRSVMRHRVREIDPGALVRPAVVISPHFDDETLGCGGTIIKKRRMGADVKIVFMTDGSKSHRDLIPEEELRSIRSGEGLAAGRALGLDRADLFFLEFEETRLSEQVAPAIEKVGEILAQQQPEEVFIPYRKEPLLWSEDHLTTTRIALSALQGYGRRVTVLEYPIWLWRNWPWVGPPRGRRRRILRQMCDGIVAGIDLLWNFRHAVYIGDILDLKRAALAEHRSQVTRLLPDPRWRTLGDVSDGAFLDCFFQEYEVFHRCVVGGEYADGRSGFASESGLSRQPRAATEG